LVSEEHKWLQGSTISRGVRNLEMSPDEKKKSIYGDLNQGTMLNSKKKQMNPTRHQF